MARWRGRTVHARVRLPSVVASAVLATFVLTCLPAAAYDPAVQGSRSNHLGAQLVEPLTREGDDVLRYSAVVTVATDGSLEIEETYRFGRTAFAAQAVDFSRTITTREQYDADNDRLYDVDDVQMTLNGQAVDPEISSDDDSRTITHSIDLEGLTPPNLPSVTLSYRVDGAVAQTADGLEVRWPVVQGLSSPVVSAQVSWNAPGVVWLLCLAGAPGSSRPCTTAQLVDAPAPRMTQVNLDAGDQMVGILGLTADSGIEPSVELKPRWTWSRSFTASGAPLWLALGVLAIGLLAAFGLWFTRGRDAGAPDASPHDPLVDGGDGVIVVVPPGAVRPGQLGTLVDERADVADVSATIIDLATRNYLFIEEIAHGAYGRMDWRLRRRNDPGEELLGFEREVLAAVFTDADDVLVSALSASTRSRLAAIQALMYDDLVRQGWFGERPDAVRGRWTTAGWVLVVAGAVLTAALALAGTFGLVGVAVVIAGAALALSGQLAPSRTAKGAQLLGELHLFRAWMERADVSSIPVEQREQVVSRLYPYALVYGLGERWAGMLASLDEDPDPDAPLYWYGAPHDWHLSDIVPSLEHLVAGLNAVLASRSLLARPR